MHRMINKNNRLKYKKLIFSAFLISYISGLCFGCSYCFNSSESMDFILSVSGIISITEVFSASNTGIFIRDLSVTAVAALLKNSMHWQCLGVCIPFFVGIQESTVITAALINNINIYHMMLYLIRNTSTVFLIIMFSYVIMFENMQGRGAKKKLLSKTIIYLTGIVLIHIIYISVITIISVCR